MVITRLETLGGRQESSRRKIETRVERGVVKKVKW
jgi:hypothetical protein